MGVRPVSATRAQRTARARRFRVCLYERANSLWSRYPAPRPEWSSAVSIVTLRHLLRIPQGEVRERIWDLLAVLEGREVPR